MTCSLRRAADSDAEAIYDIRGEPSARVFQPLEQMSLSDLRSELYSRSQPALDSTLESKVQWVVIVDDEVAGWISLDITSRLHGIASVGYTIGESFRGRGLATSAVQQLTNMAFDPNGIAIARLEAVAAVDNLASQRVLIKSGFREEGIARGLLVVAGKRVDHVRFGLLVDDVRRTAARPCFAHSSETHATRVSS